MLPANFGLRQTGRIVIVETGERLSGEPRLALYGRIYFPIHSLREKLEWERTEREGADARRKCPAKYLPLIRGYFPRPSLREIPIIWGRALYSDLVFVKGAAFFLLRAGNFSEPQIYKGRSRMKFRTRRYTRTTLVV